MYWSAFGFHQQLPVFVNAFLTRPGNTATTRLRQRGLDTVITEQTQLETPQW